MSLDIFQSNIDDAVNYAARASAPELPSTFSDNFHDAWNKGYLTAQSVSGRTRRSQALGEFVDDAIRKTGDNSLLGTEENGYADLDTFNARLAAHKERNPTLDVAPITEEMIQARADDIGKRQLQVSADFDRRERTFGGSVGSFLGTAAAAISDPVNLIAFPLAAPESLGVVGTTLAWGGIAGGSQATIEALNSSSMERIQPGYRDSGEPLANVLEAAAFGGALGGGLKGLAALWTRNKSGAWPRTIRDAGNVVESEAQIAATNPFVAPAIQETMPSARSLKLVSAPEGGIYTPDQIKPNERYFKAVDANGNVTAEILVRIDGTTARIEDILNPNAIREEGVGTIGNRQLLGLLSQFRKQYPEITELTGQRVSGSRMGGEYSLLGEPTEVSVRLKPLSPVEGEAVHRTALNKAIDDLANGRPVDVDGIVPPEAFAARDAAIDPVITSRSDVIDAQAAARAAADEALATGKPQAELPFAQTEAAALAEAKGAQLTQGVQDIARLTGYDMPVDEAARIADRIAKLDDPEKARALLDEVFLRPSTIADTLPAVEKPVVSPKVKGDLQALREELQPAKIEEMRVDPDLPDTVSRDLDKLMLERPDLEVPMGVTVDAEGAVVPATRKVESVVAEADARLAAAKEIEACVGPYPEAAE